MKYIAGDCSDKKTHYYELSDDFIIILCRENIRYNCLKTSYDYDVLTEDIDLYKGDIIHIKYFGYRNQITYIYLLGYTNNDIYVKVNKIDKIIRNHE